MYLTYERPSSNGAQIAAVAIQRAIQVIRLDTCPHFRRNQLI